MTQLDPWIHVLSFVTTYFVLVDLWCWFSTRIKVKERAMGRIVGVQFRGEERDVEIDRDCGYEPDTGAHEIEWHFYGMTPEQHEAPAATAEEEQEILAQLSRISGESESDIRDL